MKFIPYVVIMIVCSGIVFSSELVGDCVFRVAVEDVFNPYSSIVEHPCNDDEFIVGFVGISNHVASGYHFFHEFITIADTFGSEKGWVDSVICCPGTNGLGIESGTYIGHLSGRVPSECSGTEMLFYADNLDTGGTHIERNNVITHNEAYRTPACLTIDGTNTECIYTREECDSQNNYYCVARIPSNSETNVHITDCRNEYYETKICCKVQQNLEEEICNNRQDDDNDNLIDCNDPECNGQAGPGGIYCCDINQQCIDVLGENYYCSRGLLTSPDYPLETGRCCFSGRYFNPAIPPYGDCADTTRCGFDPEEFACHHNPLDGLNEFIAWANDPNCIISQDEGKVACCSGVDIYGAPDNYFVPIIIYDGTPN